MSNTKDQRTNGANYSGPYTIQESEHAELIELLNQTFREDGGDMFADYPRHLGMNNQENIRVMKCEDRIVAHVATTVRHVLLGGIPTQAAGIGAVATHIDHRGNRLASILMDDAVKRSVEQGADIMLISGDEGVYKRMHAAFCGRYPKIVLEKKHVSSQCNVSLKPVEPQDLDDVIRIRQTMPTRYVLPKEDLTALLACRKVMDKEADWWLAMMEHEAVGFGTTHVQDGEIHLLDWSGHAAALKRAAAFWMEQYEAERLIYHTTRDEWLPVGWHDWIEKEEIFYGTVLVIDAARFMQRAKPYFEEKAGEENWCQIEIDAKEQSITFRCGNETAHFENGGELAELFFGVPERDVLAGKMAPDSKLYAILSSVFPIPLVWYGVGYV